MTLILIITFQNITMTLILIIILQNNNDNEMIK